MSHRGPDESDLHVMENGSVLSHERLSICIQENSLFKGVVPRDP
jgi:asparagine synthetase B (glutamine-hydrolysing)